MAIKNGFQSSPLQARWTVGKLNCPFCAARLGGFNFVNCSRCPCGHEDVVHISKSRVDHDSKCPSVVPLRPLRARMRSAGRTSSQDELRDPEAERMVRGGSEGCLPDAQSSCPAILRLIGTSTPITPPHRLAAEAEQAEGQAPLPTVSSQSLSGFCGISSLSCFGESSLKRLLDMAEVETVGEVRLSSPERDSPALLVGLSRPLLSPASEAGPEAISREEATHLGSCESPIPLHSGQQQDMGTPVEDVSLPEALLHVEPHQASIPGSRVPTTDSADGDGEGGNEEGEWAVAPRAHEAPQSPPRSAATAEPQLSKREKNRLKSQRRKQRKIERWLRSQLDGSQGVRPAKHQIWSSL